MSPINFIHDFFITHKNNHTPLFTGTIILTGSALISRFMGLFNRIYLSQLIGAKELGIYQLIFPIYMIILAFSCHGMELALSQMVASIQGKYKPNIYCASLVKTATILSLLSALFFSAILYNFAEYISIHFFKEPRSNLCLKLMAPVFPFTAIRSCLRGYYIGIKETFVPASSQIIEQTVRISIIGLIAESYGNLRSFSAALAVCAMVTGEIASTIYTYISYKIHIYSDSSKNHKIVPYSFSFYTKELLKRALPMTANKLSLTLVSSLESILIPYMLAVYYQNRDIALSMYGILTGMVMPFLLFPSSLTNSLSTLLLPAIAQAHAADDKKQLQHMIKKTIQLCFSIGFTALIIFFFFGKSLGTLIFHNSSAGDFLFILSFLCPFLYLSSVATSILNGLGLMTCSFLYNIIGVTIRICFILFAIPQLGIQGYFIGLLAGQLILTILQWSAIIRKK